MDNKLKIEKLLKIESSLERINEPLAYFVVFIFLIYLVCMAFAQGANWNIYDNIAMSDRWISDNYLSYSKGMVDGFSSSTPYFPGNVFLAVIFKLFGTYQVESMLIFAAMLILLFIVSMNKIYKNIGGTSTFIQYIAVSLVISRFWLPTWLLYALQLKPDTIALLFFMLTYNIVIDYKEKCSNSTYKILGAIYIIIITCLSQLFKQQIVATFGGICFGLLLSINKNNFIDNFIKIISILIGISIALIIVFSISGGAYFSIFAHIGRHNITLFNKDHFILIAKTLVITLTYLIISHQNLRKIYLELRVILKKNNFFFISAVFWLIVGVMSARNYGGNIGNTTVGIVLFLPLICFLFDRLPIKNLFKTTTFILLIAVSIKFILFGNWYEDYKNRIQIENIISEYLIINKLNCKLLISSDSYSIARECKANHISSFNTWEHLHNGENVNNVPINGNEFLKAIMPDAIVMVDKTNKFNKVYNFNPTLYGYKQIKFKNYSINDVLYVKVKT